MLPVRFAAVVGWRTVMPSRPRRFVRHLRRNSVSVAGALALLALGSCQGPSGRTPGARPAERPFPTPSELDELGPGPRPADLFRTEVEDVGEWTLEGPFPERVEVVARPAGSPWERVLEAAVAQRAGLAISSEAMHCTAREVGRFLLMRGKLPVHPLVEFMAARCGAEGASFSPAFLQGEVPASVSDEALLASWRGSLDELVQRSFAGGAVAAGLWFGREAGRAVVAIVASQRRVHVEPFAARVEAARVELRGEVLAPAESIEAWINQGDLGFAACEGDPGVAPPRFSFRCTPALDDGAMLIEVNARERGRILSERVLGVLARRPGEDATIWRRPGVSPSRPVAGADAFPEAVAAALDEVRRGAGLAPLGLSHPQSETASQLAPHVFAGAMGLESPVLADLAALGIAAGWRVGDTIRDANLASAMLPGALDAGRWVDAVLAKPTGRAALLDPDARILAVGTLASETPALVAAVAATYQVFDEDDLGGETARFLERLARSRAERGRSRPELVASVRPLVEEAGRAMRERGLSPARALEDVLARASTQLRRPVRGWHLEASRVELLPLPEELASAESLQLAVAMSWHQPEDLPWGQWVALVVIVPGDLEV